MSRIKHVRGTEEKGQWNSGVNEKRNRYNSDEDGKENQLQTPLKKYANEEINKKD